jgi:hypothetical protein
MLVLQQRNKGNMLTSDLVDPTNVFKPILPCLEIIPRQGIISPRGKEQMTPKFRCLIYRQVSCNGFSLGYFG